jgi:Domain of Unknown Function (DUF1907)
MGPGAGYEGVAGINCELMATAKVVQGSDPTSSTASVSSSSSSSFDSEPPQEHRIRSQCAKIREDYVKQRDDPSGGYLLQEYPSLEVGPLINLLISDGDPQASVIRVRVRTRTGERDLVGCMRAALDDAFPQPVGLAGVFQVLEGKVRAHVMPGFPACYLRTDAQVQAWLNFFDMPAPLTCLSIMMNRQLEELDLRVEHTHFYSEHGCG